MLVILIYFLKRNKVISSRQAFLMLCIMFFNLNSMAVSRSRSTVVYSYDLTTCPSWVQTPNGPCRHKVGLTILLQGGINKLLKAKPTGRP